MPRNMSFALTKDQFRNRTKTVTRRLGWKFLKPGDTVMGCEKCMGLKPGEKINRLGLIKIEKVSLEKLNEITKSDVIKEGFPGMSCDDFVKMFLNHMKPNNGVLTYITRIEFSYL